MKIKSYLCLLLVVISSITISAQKMSTADQFLSYFNNYQKKELTGIITSDFKFKREFSEVITDRKEFLNKYLEDSQTLIAKFKVIKKPEGENQNYYVVEDQSQYLKLLDVKFPKWNMTITTAAGKVSQAMLSPTSDYDNYVTELTSKTEKFNSWMEENHPEVDWEKLKDLSQVLEYLNEYVESKGILLPDLQQYDDSTEAAVTVSDSDSLFDNMTCMHRNKFTETKRASFYPFNKAKKVLLISFNDKDWKLNYYSKSPKIIDISKVVSSKQLNKADLNRLTDLFYNYGYKKMELVKTISQEFDCSGLKNAIVFLDEKGNPFEYIAFAFDCYKIEFSSQKISYGDECTTKRELLEQFFISNGIETGQ